MNCPTILLRGPGPLQAALAHRLSRPDPTEPELLAWFRPLLIAARQARQDDVPWPINIDEFHFIGRVDRPPRPSVWLYQHLGSGGEMAIDRTGQAYWFIWAYRGRSNGRLKPCSIRTAIHRARLPDAVEPVWAWRDPQLPY